tara:strand:- start:11568 stop:11867 length:300 start_codon:yes stop_codon:yes gene_type:complete
MKATTYKRPGNFLTAELSDPTLNYLRNTARRAAWRSNTAERALHRSHGTTERLIAAEAAADEAEATFKIFAKAHKAAWGNKRLNDQARLPERAAYQARG